MKHWHFLSTLVYSIQPFCQPFISVYLYTFNSFVFQLQFISCVYFFLLILNLETAVQLEMLGGVVC